MTEKITPDWERIEIEYRAGILSLREIAAAYPGVSHVAIAKRAKKDGWVKDLTAKIKLKADELVNRAEVNASVNNSLSVTEKEIVEANAERIAQVRSEHRKDISRYRKLAHSMLNELESMTEFQDEIDKMFEFVNSPGENEDPKAEEQRIGKMREALSRVMSSAGRIDSLKKLSETLKTLVGLEREAYNISDVAKDDDAARMDASQRSQRLSEIMARVQKNAERIGN